MLMSDRGRPSDNELCKALTAWAFNMRTSNGAEPFDTVRQVLAWLERNTREVADLAQPAENPVSVLAWLVAFFGAMYHAALRPGEVVTLRRANLALRAG